jgi:hypothetical protein
MRTKLLAGVMVVAMAALIGINSAGVAAQPDSRTWSVAVHIEYPDGFVYDHAFATGVPTSELPSILSDCGKSHWFGAGSAVRYHCYPIPE